MASAAAIEMCIVKQLFGCVAVFFAFGESFYYSSARVSQFINGGVYDFPVYLFSELYCAFGFVPFFAKLIERRFNVLLRRHGRLRSCSGEFAQMLNVFIGGL